MKPDDDFFVGYLPFPKSLKIRYICITLALLLVSVVVATTLAGKQQAAGKGTWNVADATSITGRLSIAPYPIVHTGEGESILLVVQGKKNADTLASKFDGELVIATGFEIQRGGWQMLELPATGAPIVALANPSEEEQAILIPEVEPLGEASVQGEIVDSKCFLGVMKPGSGKVHRACATLCLLGGLPPMLVVKTDDGRYGYLLVDTDSGSASRQLANQVAIPVTLTGDVERRGDLLYIRSTYNEHSLEPLVGEALSGYGDTLAVESTQPEFCGAMSTKPLANS